MKRLLVLSLLCIAVPAHAASNARDLLEAMMLEQTQYPVLESWSFDVPAASEIAWDSPKIEYSEARGAYTRTGRVALKPHDDFTWQVTLIGPRAGPMGIEFDSVSNLQQLGPHGPDLGGLALTPHLCDANEMASFGMRVDVVEVPGKKPAFLRREWSCGSAGCAVKLSLHHNEGDVEAVSELDDPPPCPGAPVKPTAGAAADRRIQGQVFNAMSNSSAGVEIGLARGEDGSVTGQGVFDNRKLFGAFDASGRGRPCDGGAECFELTGEFRIGGDDGSGFPAGTRTSFVIAFAVQDGRVRGVYDIGPLPGTQGHQYGILDGEVSQPSGSAGKSVGSR